jgi:PAS domain S-box-containing protein
MVTESCTRKILVVDDDCISINLISRILTPHFDVHLADSAKAAVQIVDHFRFDAIILDVQMPETNGFDLCTIIRSNHINCSVPIIFISSSEKPEDKVKGFMSGCDDYITKPFVATEIICRINNHIGHYLLKNGLENMVAERTAALREEIEQRKVVEIQHKKLATVVTHSPLSIMIVGINGLIEYVNPQFTRSTGYISAESIGSNPRFLKSGYTLPEEYESLWRCITSGNIWTGVFCTLRKDLSELWENVTIAPVNDDNNQISHYVAIKEDITKAKQLENELLASKEIALGADRAKENFIKMISHELRTPLNSIIGFAELLTLQPYGDLGDPRYVEYSKQISDSGHLQLKMIMQLIDLSLLSSGRFTVMDDLFGIEDSIDLAVKSALLINGINCRNIRTNIACPALIRGDIKVLENAFYNLIINSAVFTPEDGEIIISVNRGWQGSLVVTISDNGPGISDNDLIRVLQPFSQAEDILTRQNDGLGLGLPLSKLMVELHGGSLKLESYVGRGTNIIIRIPSDRIVSM